MLLARMKESIGALSSIGAIDGNNLNVSESVQEVQVPFSPSDVGSNFPWNEIFVSILVAISSVAAYFVIRYFLNRAAESLQIKKGQLKGIYSITKLILVVIAITIIIFQFSSTSGVAAGAISVAAGTIIGFSSRNTISNAIAGILLLSARPFKIGDRIRTSTNDELIGDVIEINLLYTKLRTVRNELVAIPNQLLLQQQIINYSGLDVLACIVEVGIRYEYKRDLIEQLLLEAGGKVPQVIKEPVPVVLLKRLDSYSALFELRAYTDKPNEYLKIQSEIRKNIFDLAKYYKVNLTIPQVQTDVQSPKDIGQRFGTDSSLA